MEIAAGILPREYESWDELPPSMRRLWPTPKATDSERGGRGDLLFQVRHGRDSRRKNWPTPVASDAGSGRGSSAGWGLRNAAGGSLNPPWIEWLMGFPAGWTDCGD